MRYELINGQPAIIKRATINGLIYSNPSDALLDANGIGYTRTVVNPPEISDETKKLSHAYEIVNGSITDVWTVLDKTAEELIALYTEQIFAIYNSADDFKNNGKILYQATGKEYIPRWVYEYYNAVLIHPEDYFPSPESTLPVTAVDGTSDDMTYEQFLTFYIFLIQTFMGATANQNSEIKTLTDKIKALRQ